MTARNVQNNSYTATCLSHWERPTRHEWSECAAGEGRIPEINVVGVLRPSPNPLPEGEGFIGYVGSPISTVRLNLTEKDQSDQQKNGHQHRGRIQHVTSERGHFDLMVLRNALYHKVWPIPDIAIGTHKHRSNRHSAQK